MIQRAQIIESQDMGQRTHILDYWGVVRKRLPLAITIFGATVSAVLLYVFLATPVYEASTQILLTSDLRRTVMGAKLEQNIIDDQLRFETELKILEGDPVYRDVLSTLRLTDAGSDTEEYAEHLGKLKESVSVERVRNTNLIEITAMSTAPDSAAILANTVVQVYIDKYKARELESSRSTASWINDQLLDLEYKVRKTQQTLLEYITQEKIVFVDDGSGIEGELKSDIFKAPNESILDDIRAQLIEAELQREKVLQKYKGEHPNVQHANADVLALRREYTREKARIDRNRDELSERIIDARKKSVQYDILRRQVDTNKEIFDLFTKKLQEIDLTKGLGGGDIQITEEAAVPIFPTSPNKKILLLIGLVLGLTLGVVATLMADYMDRSLKSKEEFEEVTGLPVLSSISRLNLKKGEPLDFKNYFKAAIHRQEQEYFRLLRANIKFSDLNRRSQVLLITSCCPGEGKTTIATRLALNMSAAGEKVLLIDADLRKPMVHRFLKLGNKLGLSNLMLKGVLNQAFIYRDVMPNMDVMTSGPIPAQPTELIENSQVRTIIETLAKHYDRIIIDSAPIGAVVDAAILATMAQGVLLVVDPRASDRRMLLQSKSQLENVGARMLGLVLNRIPENNQNYYYYSMYASSYAEQGASNGSNGNGA